MESLLVQTPLVKKVELQFPSSFKTPQNGKVGFRFLMIFGYFWMIF